MGTLADPCLPGHLWLKKPSLGKSLKVWYLFASLVSRQGRDRLIATLGKPLMLPPFQSPARLAFGPFEVNVPAGQLLKGGVRIRLSGQPFQILMILLAHPGDVVTNDQLREGLWKEGTFVDFEHGLHAAVNKLRRGLSDSAENPRYIETVPGRGYRFIGAVAGDRAPIPFEAVSLR